MSRIPLQYQSLKAVLLYMEANVRFQISQRMPSIRDVEKLVPLKINRLEFAYYEMTINDTVYKLRIHRHYFSGKTPKRVKEQNEGGIIDYDEFRFELDNGNSVLFFGDVLLNNETPPIEMGHDDVETEARWRRILRCRQKALELRAELKSKGQTYKDYLDNVPQNPDDPDEEEVREIIHYDDETLRSLIEMWMEKLMPFDWRRSNTKPPFTCYFRLTIKKGKNAKVQRYKYNKRIYEAMKHLNQVIFGGRPMPIFVEHFDTDDLDFCSTLRVPIGFSLRVKALEIFPFCEDFGNLNRIVENSENLDTVWLSYDGFFALPPANDLTQNSRKLVISSSELDIQDVYESIGDFQNPLICFNITAQEYTAQGYLRLIQHWSNENRSIGSKLYIGTNERETAEEVLQRVSSHYDNAPITERCVTVNISESKKLEIFYEPFEEKHVRNLQSNWIMKMRIMEN